jgi:hypothetical protein
MASEHAVLAALVAFAVYTMVVNQGLYFGSNITGSSGSSGSSGSIGSSDSESKSVGGAKDFELLHSKIAQLTETIEQLKEQLAQQQLAVIAATTTAEAANRGHQRLARSYLCEVDAVRYVQYPQPFISQLVSNVLRPHSLWAHPIADNADAEIEYNLNGRYSALRFGVALHDQALGRNLGSLTFSVVVDGVSTTSSMYGIIWLLFAAAAAVVVVVVCSLLLFVVYCCLLLGVVVAVVVVVVVVG